MEGARPTEAGAPQYEASRTAPDVNDAQVQRDGLCARTTRTRGRGGVRRAARLPCAVRPPHARSTIARGARARDPRRRAQTCGRRTASCSRCASTSRRRTRRCTPRCVCFVPMIARASRVARPDRESVAPLRPSSEGRRDLSRRSSDASFIRRVVVRVCGNRPHSRNHAILRRADRSLK